MTEFGARVCKVGNLDVIPSAVFIDSKGRMYVGQTAYSAMAAAQPERGEGYTSYKLRIGQKDQYHFAAAGRTLTAPELGSAVIGELLKAYVSDASQLNGIEMCRPNACVITIPAKFEQSACEGTRKAAAGAGLASVHFIMEPVAAAMAYGFDAARLSKSGKKPYWMVFDLGGGTLDVSLVAVREGKLVVPEEGHDGDPTLGGRKFDRELFDFVLMELKRTYSLKSFSESDPAFRVPWRKLMLAVEEAKIKLSQEAEVRVEYDGTLCTDDRGKAVYVDVPVTRLQYEQMIKPLIERTVHICQNVLAKNRLGPDRIERLILVGGPTKTPLLRRVLAERLAIDLDSSKDPMTVVALGAAVYADTIPIPRDLWQGAVASPTVGASMKLAYERQSATSTCVLNGTVFGLEGTKGCTVVIKREDGNWVSGQEPIGTDGSFEAELLLIDSGKPELSRFTTTLYSPTGAQLATLKEPEIWFPYPSVQNRLANSLRIGLKANATSVLIAKGAELLQDAGAHGSGKFATTKALSKGSQDDLHIPVLESVVNLLGNEDTHADCSVHVGSIVIRGESLQDIDLPLGAEIRVDLVVNESRKISGRAEIPLIDDEFPFAFEGESYQVELPEVESRFENIESRFDQLRSLQAAKPLPNVAAAIEIIDQQNAIESARQNLERAKNGDRDALYSGYRTVLALDSTLNEISRMQRRVRVEGVVETLRPVATGSELDGLNRIAASLSTVVENDDAWDKAERALRQLEWDVRGRPWNDVALDVAALGGLKASSYQNSLFTKAIVILDRISDRGGLETATDAELDELRKIHEELMRAYPDLWRLRNEELEKLGKGIQPAYRRSDVEAR